MSDELFDPKWVDDCPSCARRAKELEAEAGLRCSGCLVLFDERKAWLTRDTESPELCRSCARAARVRVRAEGAGRYGQGRNT